MNKNYIEYDGDNEKPKNRIHIASVLFLIFSFPISILAFYPIKYLEGTLVLTSTVKNFAIPIFLITLITCYKNYFCIKKNTFKTKMTFLGESLSLTILILVCIGSTIVLTNNYLGSTSININGIVVNYSESRTGSRYNKNITISDTSLGKNINIDVEKRFTVGEKITIQMKKGFWGFLYTTE